MNHPDELKYTKTHEWVKINEKKATIGITDFAQGEMGDIVFIELPEIGKEVVAGKECAVVESVKTASEIYAPVSGTVTKVNGELKENPDAINADPYNRGWIFAVELAGESADGELVSAQEYVQTFVKSA